MIFIVGDIHGEITKLKNLIQAIENTDSNSSYVFLGDYLDKGEDAFETLNFLVDLSQRSDCVFLIGNHEYIWLTYDENNEKARNYLLRHGGKETMRSLNAASIEATKDKLLSNFFIFFSQLQKYWKNEDYIVVHSGIPVENFEVDIDEIPINRLLFNRYNFIKASKLYQKKYKIVFGHTGFYSPYVDNFKIGIDTAACFLENQPLTAYCPELNMFVDSHGNKKKIDLISRNCCPNIVRVRPWRNDELS